jgi:TetR/AcrR family transcriptional regulator, lmrAB and yxaGH operons repressor
MSEEAVQKVPADTRSRILKAALRLFRQHGYHGVGLNDILAMAQAPKGSMYHHFPGGKEEIGVAVVALIHQGVLGLIDAQAQAPSTALAVRRIGSAMLDTLTRAGHDLCTLYAAFAAERNASPRLAQAVSDSYAGMASRLETRLRAEGVPRQAARDKAALVVMLLEGGSLLAAATQDAAPFKLAVRQAADICAR